MQYSYFYTNVIYYRYPFATIVTYSVKIIIIIINVSSALIWLKSIFKKVDICTEKSMMLWTVLYLKLT